MISTGFLRQKKKHLQERQHLQDEQKSRKQQYLSAEASSSSKQ